MRRGALRAERAGAVRRLLPLHALPAPHRDGGLAVGADRRPQPSARQGRGARQGLAPSRRRLGEVLLPRVRVAALQPQPRRPGADGRAHVRVRRRSGRAPEPAPVRRLRRGVGADPGRRAAAASRSWDPHPAARPGRRARAGRGRAAVRRRREAAHDRSIDERRMPMRRRCGFELERAGARRDLLPLHALPAPHRDGGLPIGAGSTGRTPPAGQGRAARQGPGAHPRTAA